ncbi:MAG TPA: tRNA (adenosine(37)-N6)-dimethylallyltransferase MiaA [Actinomycetota bacterium]|nr:tRNA (adenosine(37)-N6)-dimethylallyltransferase MiaA [Actinomycetota bacterium]
MCNRCRRRIGSPASKRRVIAIVGPTAVGKSLLSMQVAGELGAEIVSVDSAMVYRGMDIGTAKPTAADRQRVPHHMIDVAEPTQNVTVAEFQQGARAAIESILDSGKLAVLVGGSGLYFRAVVDPLEFPSTNPEVRRNLEIQAMQQGGEKLYRRLLELDPQAAERIHPSNERRTVRALEVIELTGRRFSSFRTAWDRWTSIYDLVVAGLRFPRTEMDERINARVDWMMEEGWLEEVRALEESGRWSATSEQALGYAQLRDHLRGHSSLEEAIEMTKRQTRRFARRQLRWFGADPRVRWFDHDPGAAFSYLTSRQPTTGHQPTERIQASKPCLIRSAEAKRRQPTTERA